MPQLLFPLAGLLCVLTKELSAFQSTVMHTRSNGCSQQPWRYIALHLYCLLTICFSSWFTKCCDFQRKKSTRITWLLRLCVERHPIFLEPRLPGHRLSVWSVWSVSQSATKRLSILWLDTKKHDGNILTPSNFERKRFQSPDLEGLHLFAHMSCSIGLPQRSKIITKVGAWHLGKTNKQVCIITKYHSSYSSTAHQEVMAATQPAHLFAIVDSQNPGPTQNVSNIKIYLDNHHLMQDILPSTPHDSPVLGVRNCCGAFKTRSSNP